jgi:hypothetical protein
VQFFLIYCREAHPIDGERPDDRLLIEDPVTTAERRLVAEKFVTDLKLKIPTLLDTVGDQVGQAYTAQPDRLYLVGTDGKLAYAGRQGPQGFDPDELKESILVAIGRE